MLCRRCATTAKAAPALSKTMTMPSAQRRGHLEWWRSLLFFKVRQKFVQDFTCDQSWIAEFGLITADSDEKRLHQNNRFQFWFQYQNRPILSTVFYPNLIHYHAMTFWKFSALSFVSLDTKWYQPRTFSGSCLNCPIHILWFLFKWNHIWGSCCRKGYHLLKECHGMSRIGWYGSLPNSISDDTLLLIAINKLTRLSAEFEFSAPLSRPNVDDSRHTHNLM